MAGEQQQLQPDTCELRELHFMPLPAATNVYGLQVVELSGEAIILVMASTQDGQRHCITAAKFNPDTDQFEVAEPDFVYLPGGIG